MINAIKTYVDFVHFSGIDPMVEATFQILYSFRRCPYAMRARLAIYSRKIVYEHREVDLKHKPVDMLKVSPKGTVPVLCLVDGTVLEQSLDIMNWAFDNSRLSASAQEIIAENDTSFKIAIDRYKYPNRYPHAKKEEHRGKCEEFLKKIEGLLNPFLSGSTLSMIDMAIFPFIRQFSMVEPDWFQQQPYPRVKEWLNDFTSSLLFKQIMQVYAPWSPGDEPILVTF